MRDIDTPLKIEKAAPWILAALVTLLASVMLWLMIRGPGT